MDVLTRQEVSSIYKLNPKTLDYLVQTHQIPYSRLGRRMVRFDRDRLEKWFASRENIEFHRRAANGR